MYGEDIMSFLAHPDAFEGMDEVVATGTIDVPLDFSGDRDIYDVNALYCSVLGAALGSATAVAAAVTAPVWATALGVAAATALLIAMVFTVLDTVDNWNES